MPKKTWRSCASSRRPRPALLEALIASEAAAEAAVNAQSELTRRSAEWDAVQTASAPSTRA